MGPSQRCGRGNSGGGSLGVQPFVRPIDPERVDGTHSVLDARTSERENAITQSKEMKKNQVPEEPEKLT